MGRRIRRLGDWNSVLRDALRLYEVAEELPTSVAAYVADAARSKLEKVAPPEVAGDTPDARLVRFSGDVEGVGVALRPSFYREDELDPRTFVLYLVPVSGPVRGQETVYEAVVEYGPWTLDLVPVPVPKGLDVFGIRESIDTVTVVEKRNKEFWQVRGADMANVGVHPAREVAGGLGVPVRRDFAAMSIRLELGLGARAIPHWRPAIRAAMRRLRRVKSGKVDMERVLKAGKRALSGAEGANARDFDRSARAIHERVLPLEHDWGKGRAK